MKTVTRVISYAFHPLLMPSLGLLLILNSGTYLSLLDPAAKRAILFVMALGTLFFPLMMLPILYYRNLVTSFQDATRESKMIPHLIILVLYIITFVYFVRLPLSKVIHSYMLSGSIILFVIVVISFWYSISSHMAALGGITGLIVTLILLYETPLQGFLICTLIATGITGSARLAGGFERPVEVYSGFLVGFVVVIATLLVY
jgi:hypothetical protein